MACIWTTEFTWTWCRADWSICA